MNCINLPTPSTSLNFSSPEERANELISFASKNLNLDLSSYYDDILFAASRDILEFTYLGPGIMEKKEEVNYNCYLQLLFTISK